MIRRLKKDVELQLPEKSRRAVLVVLKNKDLKRLKSQLNSNRLEREMQRKFDGDYDGPHEGGSSQSIMELFHETGKAKLPAVCEYLKTTWESFPHGEKLLVWAHHIDVLNGLENFFRDQKGLKLSKSEYVRIDGSVNMEEKQRRVNAFQRQDRVKIALLGIKAVGTGVTLTRASRAIFAELVWNPSNLRQAEDRLHRIGQKNAVEIQYILAEGSLDEKMWHMLDQKMDVTDKVLEGDIQSRDLEESVSVQRRDEEIEIKIDPLTQVSRTRKSMDEQQQLKMTDYFRRS